MDGEQVRLADRRGRAVVLNFWASWCDPCLKELPELQELHTELGDRGLEVVGVNIDDAADREAALGKIESKGVTFTVMMDPDQRSETELGVDLVPTTWVLDRRGRKVWGRVGAVTKDDPELRAAIDEALSD